MTPQERDLIQSLLGRLQQQANQPKDRDAEELIQRGMAAQPDAPYLLMQTVLIQDMALAEAHNRLKDLEQRLAAAKSAPQPAPSFLSGARGSVPSTGPWGQPAAPPPTSAPVWGQAGQPAPQQMAAPQPMAPSAMPVASSGFLRQAMTTAAGIAGGALLFEGIRSMFGPHYGGGFMPNQPGIGESVISNDHGTPAPDTREASWSNDNNSQDTGQDYAADQDGGGDSGGGDTYDV